MKRLYVTVFLVSCSVLIFEISLTRIFSITLWYHFAFMVISIAMLGIGSAGTVLAISSGMREHHRTLTAEQGLNSKNIHDRICSVSNVPFFSLMTGTAILVCFTVSNHLPFDPARFSWERLQLLYLFMYCFVLSIPFFFSGLLIATVFTCHSDKSMNVYAADMTGAGTGAVFVILLLNTAPPEYTVVAASSLCLSGALIHGNRKTASAAVFLLLINLFLALYHPGLIHLRISPYKNLSFYLRYPGSEHLKTYNSSYSRIDAFRSPGIRHAPGLSLKYADPLPDQTGLATDGQRIDVITDARRKSRLDFISFLPSAIAFELSTKRNALVLDPGGGLHVLMAEYYGFERIMKVESDPSLPGIVFQDFGSYSGGIYASNTVSGYGRNFLRREPGTKPGVYDLIDMALTGTAVSGTFGITEDYRYTVNAFIQYLAGLEQDGIISVSLYILPPFRTEFRLLATLVSALEQSGIADASSGIAAIRSWDVMTILAKKSPFTAGQIRRIREFSADRNFDLVFYPGIQPEETNRYIKTVSQELENGFRIITDRTSRASFLDNYLFDISPVYDRNPFFHYFLRADNLQAIYNIMGRKLLYFLNEGYLAPVILCVVLFLSFLIILLPVILSAASRESFSAFGKPQRNRKGIALPALVYFGMLGLGFMFVEVPLIQTSILAVENPPLCVAAVITAVLISSGAGSMFGSRYRLFRSSYSLPVLAGLISGYTVLQPHLLSEITGYGLSVRILALSASLIPVGFFMGIPFPLGMRLIGIRNRRLIPWAWAVNACLSVTAPLLAVLLALAWGFHAVLWMSVIAYLTAFGALVSLGRRTRESCL